MSGLNDIRNEFLNYFGNKNHKIVKSSPLVPENDPSLMFTNSGMVQFKNVFTGLETRDYNCAVTSQKCIRAGGKHNDLDNVGYTSRHHTFFEMLGNFSFGYYFKEEAISFAWELITKVFGLPKEKLLVTVYIDDDEAVRLWKKCANLSDDRIIRISTSDNFWSMGTTGPCGPCSEIFFDHGPSVAGGPPGSAEEDGDRFIEIWNLVFMQYEQELNGNRAHLPKPSIDTGMGLERMGAVLQGTHDNFQTDLMRTLIEASANLTSIDPDGEGNIHHRVIADHIRSVSFLITDGLIPSNEGRGYVLRRIMRRAMRHAHLLGAKDPMMFKLVSVLAREMGQAFPEIVSYQKMIEDILLSEETRFKITLDRGLKLLDDELLDLKVGQKLSGKTAFKLYDTYGFPLDLTQDALRERNVEVDVDDFDSAMKIQKDKARAAWVGSGDTSTDAIWFDLLGKFGNSEFLGYNSLKANGRILALVSKGITTKSASKGSNVIIVLNQTPFYAESGGQVGDCGILVSSEGRAKVTNVKKHAGLFLHHVIVESGVLVENDKVELEVSSSARKKIESNHSGTHLLNEALREVLGSHVVQRGSINEQEKLRFDFSHTKALSTHEIKTVEQIVNHHIRQNSLVETTVMSLSKAKGLGAQALFGEKYEDEVRVVSMGHATTTSEFSEIKPYSIELCGGTHVKRTGEIGLFIILNESSSSSGVRRIEGLTSNTAFDMLASYRSIIKTNASVLRTSVDTISDKVQELISDKKELSIELSNLKNKLATFPSTGMKDNSIIKIGGASVFIASVKDVSPKDLRYLVDEKKTEIRSGIILMISETSGKVAAVAGVTDEYLDKISSVDLIRLVALKTGGKGGGGRPDLAQGGGVQPNKIEFAIKTAKSFIKEKLLEN